MRPEVHTMRDLETLRDAIDMVRTFDAAVADQMLEWAKGRTLEMIADGTVASWRSQSAARLFIATTPGPESMRGED
jgi:hypothetical protein